MDASQLRNVKFITASYMMMYSLIQVGFGQTFYFFSHQIQKPVFGLLRKGQHFGHRDMYIMVINTGNAF